MYIFIGSATFMHVLYNIVLGGIAKLKRKRYSDRCFSWFVCLSHIVVWPPIITLY